ncbi:hypothetical protein CC86DRAFT_405082 [Ophiobolus disseminans]|uniref:Uncharacterized protein n=1 Tax=Ophiobolus disseminans TaxID=1469910 RepID=A0A6A7A4J5_9PLEO|nr:hypothetical protein CC86DRAFT_405082 [Ophiobolus disseminans]
MTNILRDHRDIALNDRWGRQVKNAELQDHEILGMTLKDTDYVLRHHPVRCGLLKYEMELQLHYRATTIEHLTGDVLFLGWLYVVGTRILRPPTPRWPDMEYVLYKQQNRLFYGGFPKTLGEAGLELQRNPLALLEQLRYWLLADAVDLHFNMFGMIRTCSDIWDTMLPVLQETSTFSKHKSDLSWPDRTFARILETAFVAKAVDLPLPVFEKAWTIMKDAIHKPISETAGQKHWVADARLAELLED